MPETKPKLLTGGNPQIAKADGNAPVQAYIAAMPGWKAAVGRKLDELIEKAVPGVAKAVKWNTPLYGAPAEPGEKQSFFAGYNVTTRYVKLAFFRGAQLTPEPPVGSKDPNTRYFHIHEGDEIDDAQLTSWFKQAAKIPGWAP
jgi:hypothetical protein